MDSTHQTAASSLLYVDGFAEAGNSSRHTFFGSDVDHTDAIHLPEQLGRFEETQRDEAGDAAILQQHHRLSYFERIFSQPSSK